MIRQTDVTAHAKDVLTNARVGLCTGVRGYAAPPYSPDRPGPEYPFAHERATANPVYDAVRVALCNLGLDAAHDETPGWNPFGKLVQPGDTVLLKPNLVREFRETHEGHGDCLVTHGAVLRAVLDFAYIALQGRGRLIIADAPHNDADFAALRRICGLDEIQAFYARYADLPVELCDLRRERADKIDGVIVRHHELAGDPKGYVRVNLGDQSAFHEIEDLCDRLYGSEYDTSEVCAHHTGDLHEYLIAGSVLAADVVISLPKLKTHKKVGLTLNLKNLVGINGNKNWLPHHRCGPRALGGDEFATDGLKHRLEAAAVRHFKRWFPRLGGLRRTLAGPAKSLGKRIFGDTNAGAIRSGNWHGNDTTWRMVLDLNRILLYADRQGRLHDQPVRRFFSVADGIIAGEGDGPLNPTPRPLGLVLAGQNPAAVDLAAAQLIGFDHRRMPLLRGAFAEHSLPLAHFRPEDVTVWQDNETGRRSSEIPPIAWLRPHFGWRGYVEQAWPSAGAPENRPLPPKGTRGNAREGARA